MRVIENFWATVTYAFGYVSFSSFGANEATKQLPLFPGEGVHHGAVRGPIFKPPGGRLKGPGSDFLCDYSNMLGWTSCSTPENRQCWLRNKATGQEFNLSTNYEDITPTGIVRHYELDIADDWINADGLNFTEGKVFNGQYPGPWIQACWGDVMFLIRLHGIA